MTSLHNSLYHVSLKFAWYLGEKKSAMADKAEPSFVLKWTEGLTPCVVAAGWTRTRYRSPSLFLSCLCTACSSPSVTASIVVTT